MAVPKLRFKEFKEDWERIKLAKIVAIIKEKNDGANHPIMMLSAGKGFIHQKEKYSKDNTGSSLKKYILLRRGDLAYNRGNSKLRKYGCIFELEKLSALVPYVYHCFRMKNDNPTFFGKYLNSGKIDKSLRGIISSSARIDGLLNVSEKDFFNIFVSKPTLSEQQKIADFLTTFDKRITAQQNIIADLEETKKGLLQKIFSQEIRFKDDNGQDYPEWEVHKLSEYAKYVSSNASCEAPCYLGTEDMISNFGGVNITKLHGNYSGYRFAKNDIILGNIRPYLRKCWISDREGVCSTDLLVMNVKGICPKILFMKMCTDEFFIYNMKGAKGTKMPRGDKKHIMNWTFHLPTNEEEQRKIADFLSTFDKKISAEKQILSDLKEMKKGLLQQMFV